MPNLVIDCPYCLTKKQSFTCYGGYTDNKDLEPASFSKRSTVIGIADYVLFACNSCMKPVGIKIRRRFEASEAFRSDARFEVGFNDTDYHFLTIYPEKISSNTAPKYSPPNISKFFEQACRALDREDADAAGTMFRKVLDVTTKHLIRRLGHSENGTLKKLDLGLERRIDYLHTQQKLSDDLKSWAHILREGGNDANHEEEPYKTDEAKELRSFAEVFLTYVFTIPGKIAEYNKTEDISDDSEEESST